VDILRQDVVISLGSLRSALAKLREDRREGPTPRWVDDDGGIAREHWATWALQSARQAIEVMDLPARRARMTGHEQAEVDGCRAEVADLRAFFTAAGGRLLPADFPPM